MAEVSSAVVKAFGQPQATEHSDAKSDVELFIMEGLLTHFFCYYDKADKNNVWWLLGHINEQKHWLRALSHLSQSSPCDTDQIESQLCSYSNRYCVPIGVFKYYLLKILGTQNVAEEKRKQWVPPYEAQVCASMLCSDCIVASKMFIVLQGRALVGTYLIQQVSGDVTGRYIPPFYQLPAITINEVSNCY